MSKMGNVYANKCKKETPLQDAILQEKQINQKTKQ